MSCAHVRELYSPYVEGELDAQDRARFEAHVSQCARCSERLSHFENAIRGVADLPRHPIPRSFAEDVLAKVAADTPGAAQTTSRFPWVAVGRWAAGVLLGITVFLLGIQLFGSKPETDPDLLALLQQEIRESIGDLKTRGASQQSEMLEAQRQLQEGLLRTLQLSQGELEKRIADSSQSVTQAAREGDVLLRQRIEEFSRKLLAIQRSNEKEIVGLRKEIILTIASLRPGPTKTEPETLVVDATKDADSVKKEGDGTLTTLTSVGQAINHYWDDGLLVWEQDPTHPQYFAALFSIYDTGNAEASDRALWELDKLFARATAELAPGSKEKSLVQRWFGTEIDAEPVDPKQIERERVEVYRKYWNEQLRSDPEEESGDAGDKS